MRPLITTIGTDSATDFLARASTFIAQRMQAAIAERGRCLVGLSGGSTPGPVYRTLGQEHSFNSKLKAQSSKLINWSKVWLFLADDRYTRKDSPHSNQFLLRSTLLHSAPVPESQLLFPNTTLALEECVREYDAVLSAAFARHSPDLIVLGMGNDGHIASLFPPLPDDALGGRTVIHTRTDRFTISDRITLTLPALARAREALFLIRGKEKVKRWEEMLASPEAIHHWPAKAIMEKVPTTVIVGP